MYEEIVERLRNNADHYMTVEGAAGLVHLLTDAADVIEKLQQENDVLKAMQRQIVKDVPLEDLGQMVYRELMRDA